MLIWKRIRAWLYLPILKHQNVWNDACLSNKVSFCVPHRLIALKATRLKIRLLLVKTLMSSSSRWSKRGSELYRTPNIVIWFGWTSKKSLFKISCVSTLSSAHRQMFQLQDRTSNIRGGIMRALWGGLTSLLVSRYIGMAPLQIQCRHTSGQNNNIIMLLLSGVRSPPTLDRSTICPAILSRRSLAEGEHKTWNMVDERLAPSGASKKFTLLDI